jgi:sulfite reductase (NADPH) flavoprotein alpha-component
MSISVVRPVENFKKFWFQLHWFVGITAGTVLVVIGLSGATLSFREELLDAMNPVGRHVAVQPMPVLTPPELLAAVRAAHGERAINTLTVFAAPGRPARVVFAAARGERRGDALRLDPYTGAALPPLVGEAFFDWTENLHRWLLLPREQGRVATGVLAAGLLFLALSGLYLRWPRRASDWRAWLTFDPTTGGRSFLWGLHSVMGTVALLIYLVSTTTGLYWAFDAVRERVDAWASAPHETPRVRRMANPEPKGDSNAGAAGIAPAWAAFERRVERTPDGAPGWSQVIVRATGGAQPSVLFTWLDVDPSHERARNRMTVRLPDADVVQDERHASKSAGGLFLAAIYPLHMGTYFGLPGRIAMTLASLMLPVFAVTGWLLYLDRRRKKRSVREERALLATRTGALPASTASARSDPGAQEGVLVAFASQSGTAERFALRTAAVLEAGGVPVTVRSVARLDADQLRRHRRALVVASSFGEGEPPDMARRFAREMRQAGMALPQLQYGLLALGSRHYARFCGFGHALDHALGAAGAQPMFPMVEVDEGDSDTDALKRWSMELATLIARIGAVGKRAPGGSAGMSGISERPGTLGTAFDSPATTATTFARWRLASRELLNPGSLGAPLYRVVLEPVSDEEPDWRPGALLEVQPRHAPGAVETVAGATGLDGAAALSGEARAGSPQPIAPRRYSVASMPWHGRVELLVRQARHESGLGLASGWLTSHAPVGCEVAARLVPNPGFEPVGGRRPGIFIGNGSGYAGLRGHLLARIAGGQHRNWVLYGERQREVDGACTAELATWQSRGEITRLDAVFSRDQPERVYVQDRLRSAAGPVREWVAAGAVIYVCGSLEGMGAGVDAALAEVLGEAGLETLMADGRYRRDVY